MKVSAPNERLDALRNNLQSARQCGVFAGDSRLSLAARQTINELDRKLEAYDELRQEAVEEHQLTDDEGRRVLMVQGVGAVVETEDGLARYDAEAEEVGDAVPGEDIPADPQIGNALEDGDAFDEEVRPLDEEETQVTVHEVDEDFFHDKARWGPQAERRVDLLLLQDLWMTNNDHE